MASNITFTVEYTDSRSQTGRISARVDIPMELHESLNRDMQFGGQTFSRWIENNLISSIIPVINPSRPWRVVDPSIQRV